VAERPSIAQRFWSRVDKSGDCWLWTSRVGGRGYGDFDVNGDGVAAHRVAYELVKGPIPEGLVIDHLCRNKLCVNPDHLEAVTHRGNVLRGEGITARQARQTHCKRGHPLSGDNIYVYSGMRKCKTCTLERTRARRQRAKDRLSPERKEDG
jgi:hypothetical protein